MNANDNRAYSLWIITLWLLAARFSIGQITVPYESGFEKRDFLTPHILTGDAVTTSELALEGRTSLRLSADSELAYLFSHDAAHALFVDVYVKPVPEVRDGKSKLLSVHQASVRFVKDQDEAELEVLQFSDGPARWQPTGQRFSTSNDARAEHWIRLTLRVSVAESVWDFYVNGRPTLLSLSLPAVLPEKTCMVSLSASPSGPTYVDELRVGYENPLFKDHDQDGIPNQTEIVFGTDPTVYTGSEERPDQLFISVEEVLDQEEEAIGSVLRETWLGISSSSLSGLLNSQYFPHRPTFKDKLLSFELPIQGWTSNYGTRIQGLLHPPESGQYRFWIASDDESELWLSINNDEEGKQLIAYCPWATAPRNWRAIPGQKSPWIYLEADKTYFIEALHKEGGGQDHLAVAWQKKDGFSRRVIAGRYLSPKEDAPNFKRKRDLFADAGPNATLYLPQKSLLLEGRAFDLDSGPKKLSVKWLQRNGPADVVFEKATSLTSKVSFPQAGTYVLRLSVRDGENVDYDQLSVVVHDALAKNTGTITREAWLSVRGAHVHELTESEAFLKNAHLTDALSELQAPIDWASHYGTRIRGFLHPPETGLYTFWISGNDSCELWLSTNHQPKNRELMAIVPSSTGVREWNKYADQESRPVFLRANRKYFIEVLHKENSSSDHVAVGWDGGVVSRHPSTLWRIFVAVEDSARLGRDLNSDRGRRP